MATKSQHAKAYAPVPGFLRSVREGASLSQRGLGERLKMPQSWVYDCESANRQVDVAEFVAWALACGVEAAAAFRKLSLML